MTTKTSPRITDLPHSPQAGRRPDSQGPVVAPISLVEPFRWLSLGWRDFLKAPRVGLAYGLMVAVMGWLIFAMGNHPYFIAAAISGFLLIGPILGAGLIEASRTIEKGSKPNFDISLRGFAKNRSTLGRFSLILFAIAVAWITISTTALIGAIGPLAPRVEMTLWDSALRFMSSDQLFAWAAIGGVLAVMCFCISVITVPLILDKHVTASEAISDSQIAISRHPLVSAVWGLVIGLLTAIGFATALVGLIVIYPVLGHASWHAYRALQR